MNHVPVDLVVMWFQCFNCCHRIWATNFFGDGQDQYHISLVDGFNVNVTVEGTRCKTRQCKMLGRRSCQQKSCSWRFWQTFWMAVGCPYVLFSSFFPSQAPWIGISRGWSSRLKSFGTFSKPHFVQRTIGCLNISTQKSWWIKLTKHDDCW